jgi:hypothetical protein
MMVARNPKKGWSANWSGRGTAVLDYMERRTEERNTSSTWMRRSLTPIDKLIALNKRYPKRRFYQSLSKQVDRLSARQIELIEQDYWRYFKKY